MGRAGGRGLSARSNGKQIMVKADGKLPTVFVGTDGAKRSDDAIRRSSFDVLGVDRRPKVLRKVPQTPS